jgi:autotransporter family porin
VALLYGRFLLDTLHERMGAEGQGATGQWGRVAALHGSRDGERFGVLGGAPAFDYDLAVFQAGQDLYRVATPAGARTRAGLYAAFGAGRADVTHFDSTDAGRDGLTALSLGAYWTHFAAAGWYADAVLQGTWYDLRGSSTYLPELETDGLGWAASLESGAPFHLGGGWMVEPQVQAVYQRIHIDGASDGAAAIRFRDVDSLAARAGLRIAHVWSPGPGSGPQVTAWLRPSIWHEVLGDPITSFSSETGPVPFHADLGGTWAELNAGITSQVGDGLSLYANAGYQHGLDGDSTGYYGKIGFRAGW